MRNILLILTCFSLVALVWLLQQFDKDPSCVNSKVLSKIQKIESVGSLELAAPGQDISICGVGSANSVASSSIEHIQKQVSRFEELVDYLDVEPRRISVYISLSEPMHWDADDKQILIGSQYLSEKKYFLRALIRSWLLQSLKPEVQANELYVEILSDFFLAVAMGKHLVFSADKDTEYEPSWSVRSYIFSTRSLCNSVWAPLNLLSFCTGLEELESSSETHFESEAMAVRSAKNISAWSLRPIVGYLLWENYKVLNLGERSKALRVFASNLGQIDVNAIDFAEFGLKDLTPITSKFTREVLSHWGENIESNEIFEKHGVKEGPYVLKLEAAVFVDSGVAKFTEKNLMEGEGFPSTDMVFMRENIVSFFPFKEKIRLNFSDQLRVHSLSVLTCVPWSLKDLERLKTWADKVLLYDVCKFSEERKFKFAATPELTLANNMYYPVIVFHLESLLNSRGEIQKEFSRLIELFWQGSEHDFVAGQFPGMKWSWKDSVRAYRIIGEIEGVQWYRR